MVLAFCDTSRRSPQRRRQSEHAVRPDEAGGRIVAGYLAPDYRFQLHQVAPEEVR